MKHLQLLSIILVLASCAGKKEEGDASGYFEADEVVVSAQQNGQLLSFTVREGDKITENAVVGKIDVTGITLQKEQVEASIKALREKTADVQPQLLLVKKQLAVQEAQMKQLLHEQQRTVNLVKADAATPKQLDDLNAQIEQLQQQMNVTRQQLNVNAANTATQNRSVLSEKDPLERSVAQFDEQIRKGVIVNPVKGTVLARYALQGEMTATGKALYKIADLDTLILKAYITGDQLLKIKLGQQVDIRSDIENKVYKGVITQIADKSEFTPKTIQTKDERANLVYAIKIRVPNDGYLKIGMYATTTF